MARDTNWMLPLFQKMYSVLAVSVYSLKPRPAKNYTQCYMESPIQNILTQRGSTHGEFRANSAVSRIIRRAVIQAIEGRGITLDAYQEEAINMIAHKLGRIAQGDPYFVDHWQDIAGYATLTAERITDDTVTKNL